MLVEGQVHGGIAQGVAQALLEEVVYDAEGQLVTGSLMDYALPRAEDLPSFTTDQTVTVTPRNPLGAKGIGEMANNAQPPAIASAVFDAVGVWVTELPITPERVLRALEAKAEPRREGKLVVFDEELSVNTVSSGGMRFEVPA